MPFSRRYFPRVYRFARTRLGGDEDAAEEVAQTTLIKALAKVGTYRGEAALFTWLCSFCRHEIDRWFARAGRSAHVSLTDDSSETRAVLEAIATLSDEDPEQDTAAVNSRGWCTRRSITCRAGTAMRSCGSISRAGPWKRLDGGSVSGTRLRSRS